MSAVVNCIDSHPYVSEQDEFIDILYKDAFKYNGLVSYMYINKDQTFERWRKIQSPRLTNYTTTHNMYISVHSYNSKTRDQEHARTINAIFIDLDWHNEPQHEIPMRTENTLALLEENFIDGSLPRPTMMTNTGRGIGIFYVLDKCIAAGASAAAKQVRFWDFIYEELFTKYNSLLLSNPSAYLEADHKVVGDTTRVCRLPMTVNHKTPDKCVCRLINVNRTSDGNPVYYSLSDLAKYIDYNNYENKPINNKVVNLADFTNPFLVSRFKKIKRAQEVLRNHHSGCRELLSFYFYNTAIQLMEIEDAKRELYVFNGQFKYPIKNTSELNNIINSVEKRGFYKFTDKTIVDNLGLVSMVERGELTKAQLQYIGFGSSQKEIKRLEKKEANRKAKQERDSQILQTLQEHPEYTYAQVAKLFNLSERTINNIVKKNDAYRYSKKNETAASICVEKNTTINETKENNNTSVPKKSTSIISITDYLKAQKSAQESLDVVNEFRNTKKFRYISNNYSPPKIFGFTRHPIIKSIGPPL